MRLTKPFILSALLIAQVDAAHIMLVTQDGSDDSWVTALTAALPGSTFDTGLFQDFSATATTDAIAAADLIVFSRDTNSADYSNQAGEAAFWNGLAKPIVLSNYLILRSSRQGWTNGSSTAAGVSAGDETSLTVAGASYFGTTSGPQNFLQGINPNVTDSSMNFGDGTILATNNTHPSIVSWSAGDMNGSGGTFGGDRLYLATANTDLTPSVSYVFSPDGEDAIKVAVTNLIPEPSSAVLLGLGAFALSLRRRR